MTAYNYGRFVGRAIESVLAQDYPAELVQLIVVDDGSTDETPEAVRPYLDRIAYVRQENGGVVAATNRALEEADGDLICLVCADDTIATDRISRQVAFLEEHPEIGLCYGDLEMIDEHDVVTEPSYFAAYGVEPRRGRAYGKLMESCVISGGTSMIRASLKPLFHPIAPWAPFEDWWIVAKVARAALVDVLPGPPVYRYRLHGANACLEATGEKLSRQLWRETAFRRHLLTDVRAYDATLDEAVAAWRKFEWAAQSAASDLGRPVSEAIPVTDADRAAAADELERARTLAGGGSELTAAFALVRALAHDPWNAPARTLLEQLLATRPELPELGLDGPVTLALADELVADAGLLDTYAGDGRTLVVYAPDWAETDVHERLAPLLADRPDNVLALAVPPDEAAEAMLARRATTLLSRRPAARAFAHLPRHAA
jgi:hypothetical protein